KHFAIRRIAEALELAHRLGKHLRVVLLAYDPVAPLVLLEKRGCELIEAESTTTTPPNIFGDAVGVLAIHHLAHPRDEVREAVVAEFDHDPAAAHLLRDRTRGSRPCERVQHPLTRPSCDVDDSLE